jgi:UDP-glucose 4-epimerase
MAILVTGAAGFVGSNLIERLLKDGNTIFGLDNLCRGEKANINHLNGAHFFFSKVELCDFNEFKAAVSEFIKLESIEEVWHLAANSDILAGIKNPEVDLNDTFLSTYNTLRIMQLFNIRKIFFSSTSAVYGDLGNMLIHEDIGPLFPISNYGAMKLASEASISSATESFIDKAYIFRFPNVVGFPATHGIILDLIKKIKKNPEELNVLGDGTQQKAYLHVHELVEAMLFIREKANDKLNYYNIGADDTGVSVRFIAEKVVELFNPSSKIVFGSGNKGWVGDVPRFSYNIEKVKALGWRPKLNSSEAIVKAIKEIIKQETE